MHMQLRFGKRRSPIIPLADGKDLALPGQEATACEIAHSEENILAWMQYLPQDCIERMIHLGWDIST
jgi:hypothetical protein